jgi:hypothetical protein
VQCVTYLACYRNKTIQIIVLIILIAIIINVGVKTCLIVALGLFCIYLLYICWPLALIAFAIWFITESSESTPSEQSTVPTAKITSPMTPSLPVVSSQYKSEKEKITARTEAPRLPVVAYPQELETLYVNTQQMKLRAGSDTKYDELGRVFYGDAVVAIETEVSTDGGNWVKVKTGNLEGWLNRKFLSATQPANQKSEKDIKEILQEIKDTQLYNDKGIPYANELYNSYIEHNAKPFCDSKKNENGVFKFIYQNSTIIYDCKTNVAR